MTPLRIGVLGAAGIARRRMLPAMEADPGIRVVAIASRRASRAEGLASRYGARAFGDYEMLLADAEVEAVYVPLPLALHAPWVEAALRAGKHVLAEKPIAMDAATSRRLIALAAGRGLVLMENVLFVHHSQHGAVRRLAAEIGELRSFQASFAIPRLPADDIRYDPDLGGGALWDVGVYPVRAAIHFLGPELRVVGAARRSDHRVDLGGAALLRRPDGVSAQLVFGLDDAYQNSYELRGSTGRITVDRAFTPPAGHLPEVTLERHGTRERVTLPADDQTGRLLKTFVTAVRSGAAESADSLRQIELLDEIRNFSHHSHPEVPVG
ncbi:Gfo/Idh/MocA family oxidoreductase [Kineosporia sp. NBRC 101731]|uniref:Gfo/Idh/MocA family protein n=1 Tax=Kineosporia sp. NBRC 101731 TaxID=3032199 RepID=UPI0024A2107F|nr:Gfo/Idh/MocA family oxidoreductase [Kineosporia sp. NBRC 101731]GLY32462.1 oxidoreductase [Kineosporia sp. NBRC 101731]